MDHLDRTPELALDELTAALPTLGPAECARLHAFWAGADPARRATAHARAQTAATAAPDRRAAIRDVQDAIVRWGDEPQTHGTTGWGEQWVDPDPVETAGGSARSAAVPAIVDAALALALRDLLDPADFEALVDPWRDAIGDEALVDGGAPDPGSGEVEADRAVPPTT
ncbi:MAG: hypothetical protein ACYDAK_04600 [Candidatus Limnocylindrales bacterium]